MNIEHAAMLIQDTRARGAPPPKELEGVLTMAQAYAVQWRLLAWQEGRGERQAGWKIGGNSAKARELYKTVDPFAGFILESGRFASGADFDTADIPASAVLECELCFRMARTVKGAVTDRAEILDAIAGVTPAIEVAGIGREASLDPPLNIADDIAHYAYVLGEEVAPYPANLDLGGMRLRAQRNGETVFDHLCAEAIDNQIDSLVWLANHLAAEGRALEAGQVIITGSCAPPTPVAAGETWHVAFEGLGDVSARFR